MGGHGTGFILRLSDTKGVAVTNKHVVSKGPLEAQKVELSFASKDGLPEIIEAKRIYLSPVDDIAFIEFDPHDLRINRNQITVAPVPNSEEELWQSATQGADVMAFGYPLGGEGISTFGTISGIDQQVGVTHSLIQTDAVINPGNSGGPSVGLRTGLVVGINVMKSAGPGVEGTGYMIPITIALREWEIFEHNPDYGHTSYLYIAFQQVPVTILQNHEGLGPLIKQKTVHRKKK